ncbi:MAG: XRE family transcriptional regulator [Gammaproteobacteria bacterium]|nr:MAG: XRE family transcriptional regulator [Gammaproteobacteria bacterium]
MEKSIHSSEYERFLALLRKTRVQSGLTQDDIATKLNATQSFVSKCERGERRLDIVELRAWCYALNLSLTSFIELFERSNSNCCLNDNEQQ